MTAVSEATNGTSPELTKTDTSQGNELRQSVQAEPEALDLIKLAKESRAAKKGPTAEVSTTGPWLPAIVSVVAALIAVFAAGVAAGSNRKS